MLPRIIGFENFTDDDLRVFMEMAIDLSKECHDWRTQHATIIINPNGFKSDCKDYSKFVIGRGYPMLKGGQTLTPELKNRIIVDHDFRYSCMDHGEVNAIADANQSGHDLDGAILLLTWYPCDKCAEAIGKAGIKLLVYSDATGGVGYVSGGEYSFEKVERIEEIWKKYGVQKYFLPMYDDQGNVRKFPVHHQSKHYQDYYETKEFKDYLAAKAGWNI